MYKYEKFLFWIDEIVLSAFEMDIYQVMLPNSQIWDANGHFSMPHLQTRRYNQPALRNRQYNIKLPISTPPTTIG
jgi:hypothetical protein